MAIGIRWRTQICDPLRSALGRRRRSVALARATAVCIAAASIVHGTTAQAQTPAKDLWQTYMDAALGSDQSDDFDIEAITLNAALTYSKTHDPQGQRPALTRLPLMLAYGELGKRDLIKPLNEQGMHIDVSNLDSHYNDYIKTIDDYAQSYHDRWSAHENDKPYDDFKQDVRFYGWKNSYLIEIALRTKLRSEDKIGLADAIGKMGYVYLDDSDYDCAAYEYGRASETYQDYQAARDAMMLTESRFSIENPNAPATQQRTTGQATDNTQVSLMLFLADAMRRMAENTLHQQSGQPSLTSADLKKCDAFGPSERTPLPVGFDAQINRAVEYYGEVAKFMAAMYQYWPHNALFGLLDNREGMLYTTEFEMSKARPGQYPHSLAKARDAYADALSILAHASGPKSQIVQIVATNEVDLLVEAGLADEAKKIEEQYGVSPSAASK